MLRRNSVLVCICEDLCCACISRVLFYDLIKNTPGVKKERPRTKKGLAEKDMKSNEWPMPPGFDTFKSFGHDELTATLLFQVLKAS